MKKGVNKKSLANLKKGNWGKGESGNPNGRPITSLKGCINAILEGKIAAYKLKGTMNGKEHEKDIKVEATDKNSLLEIFANKTIADALSGDHHAKAILYDILYKNEIQETPKVPTNITLKIIEDKQEE